MTQTTPRIRIAHTTKVYAKLFPSRAAIDAELREMTAQRALRNAPAPDRGEAFTVIVEVAKVALRMNSASRAAALTDRVGRRRPRRCCCES